jgi:hypothetical protein
VQVGGCGRCSVAARPNRAGQPDRQGVGEGAGDAADDCLGGGPGACFVPAATAGLVGAVQPLGYHAFDAGRGPGVQPLRGLLGIGGLWTQREPGRASASRRSRRWRALGQRCVEQLAVRIGEQVEEHVVSGMLPGHPQDLPAGGDPPLQQGETGPVARPHDEFAVEDHPGRQVGLDQPGDVREVAAPMPWGILEGPPAVGSCCTTDRPGTLAGSCNQVPRASSNGVCVELREILIGCVGRHLS